MFETSKKSIPAETRYLTQKRSRPVQKRGLQRRARNPIKVKQESPADADKPARRESMQKLLQLDVFRFISSHSISPNFKLPLHKVARYVEALGLYGYTQFEIRCLPILKSLVQITST